MASIFADGVDFAQLYLDLKRDGFCTFALSKHANELRQTFSTFAVTLLSTRDTTGFIKVLKTENHILIRLETDDHAKTDGTAYPDVSTAMTNFLSRAFKEILYKIPGELYEAKKNARNIAFIDSATNHTLTIGNMIHYNEQGDGGIENYPQLTVNETFQPTLFSFSLGSTASGLEFRKNGEWVVPNIDHGIIWAGTDAGIIPPVLHDVRFTKGFGDLCRIEYYDVFTKRTA